MGVIDKMTAMKSIWLNRTFSLYAICRFISNLGTSFHMIALPLIVYRMTHSAMDMSLMGVFETIPLLASPLAGAVVDKVSRRQILLWTGIIQAILVGIMPALFYMGQLQLWHMFLIGFLLGIVTNFMRSAEFAVIPILFEESIAAANAGLSVIWTSAQLIGPLLAGTLLSIWDPFVLIVLNAVSFLATGLVFLKIKFTENVGGIRNAKQFFHDVKFGFTLIVKSKLLLTLVTIVALSNLADNGLILVIYYHLRSTLNFNENVIGWLTSSLGIGMLIGSIISGTMKKFSPVKTIYWGFTIAAIGVLLFLIPLWFFIPIGLMLVAVGGIMSSIGENVLIQQSVLNEYLGRVSGALRLLKLATRPISIFFLMWITENLGAKIAFLISIFIYALILIIMIMIPNLADNKQMPKGIEY